MTNALLVQLSQVALFSIPLTISPGPNNLMMTTNCAQFGFRRTLPSLVGISLGVFVLFMVVALGLGGVLARYPQLHLALKVVGSAYILYLSYLLFTSHSSSAQKKTTERPITFVQAALLQVLNPKIWLLAATACSTFLPITGDVHTDAILLSLTLGAIFFPCNSIWALFGLVMRGVMRGRAFYRTMGVMTASSVFFVLF